LKGHVQGIKVTAPAGRVGSTLDVLDGLRLPEANEFPVGRPDSV